jgi:hypothetical protein
MCVWWADYECCSMECTIRVSAEDASLHGASVTMAIGGGQ